MVTTFKGAPADVKLVWQRTGLEQALFQLVGRGLDWQTASERLLVSFRRNRASLTRYQNRIVRSRILAKIAKGHDHIAMDMGGQRHVALNYGAGKPSSSFVLA